MSTKNLARTVIEGGRNRYNRWLRRYSNSQERAAERRFSSCIAKRWDAFAVGTLERSH